MKKSLLLFLLSSAVVQASTLITNGDLSTNGDPAKINAANENYEDALKAWHNLSELQLATFAQKQGLPINAATEIKPFTVVAAHLLETLHGPLDDVTRAAFAAIQLEAAEQAIPLDAWINPRAQLLEAYKNQPHYPAMLLFWSALEPSMQTPEHAQWLQNAALQNSRISPIWMDCLSELPSKLAQSLQADMVKKHGPFNPLPGILARLSQSFCAQILPRLNTQEEMALLNAPWVYVVRSAQYLTPSLRNKCENSKQLKKVIKAFGGVASEADRVSVLACLTNTVVSKCANGEQLADVIKAFDGIVSDADRREVLGLLSANIMDKCETGFSLATFVRALGGIAPEKDCTKMLVLTMDKLDKSTNGVQLAYALVLLGGIPADVAPETVLGLLTSGIANGKTASPLCYAILALGGMSDADCKAVLGLLSKDIIAKCENGYALTALIQRLGMLKSQEKRKETIGKIIQYKNPIPDGWK